MKKRFLSICLVCLLLSGCGNSALVDSHTPSSAESSSSQSENNLSAQEKEVTLPEPAVAWEEVPAGDWNMILVNALHPIEQDFSVNLVEFSNVQCDERVLPAVEAMMEAAKQDGVSIYPCSGYRSPDRSAVLYQQQIQQYLDRGYEQEEAEKIAAHWVAPPGTSEHHTGLVFDFLSNDCTTMNETFAECDAAKWLEKHAVEYGFILRYPKGLEQKTGIVFEPWHYRYVGSEAAAKIKAANVTLEEYLGSEDVGYEYLEEDEMEENK